MSGHVFCSKSGQVRTHLRVLQSLQLVYLVEHLAQAVPLLEHEGRLAQRFDALSCGDIFLGLTVRWALASRVTVEAATRSLRAILLAGSPSLMPCSTISRLSSVRCFPLFGMVHLLPARRESAPRL